MSYETDTIYHVVCDGCGKGYEPRPYDDERWFVEQVDADQNALDDGWAVTGNKTIRHWCPDCCRADKDGELQPTKEALAAYRRRRAESRENKVAAKDPAKAVEMRLNRLMKKGG